MKCIFNFLDDLNLTGAKTSKSKFLSRYANARYKRVSMCNVHWIFIIESILCVRLKILKINFPISIINRSIRCDKCSLMLCSFNFVFLQKIRISYVATTDKHIQIIRNIQTEGLEWTYASFRYTCFVQLTWQWSWKFSFKPSFDMLVIIFDAKFSIFTKKKQINRYRQG